MTEKSSKNDDSLLLALWAEVGRHQELGESAAVFMAALSERLELQSLRVDELLADGSDLATLVEWTAATGVRVRHRPLGLPRSAIRAIGDWQKRRQLATCVADGAWSLPFALIEGFVPGKSAMAGPLASAEKMIGLVVVTGSEDRAFSAREQALFRALLEPLAAAVENDRRLREIRRLSAAAEADRQTLLSRLGRKTLSETVVGADRGLRRVMERVGQVAPSDATVLILGETGSGKEVIARAIHERSARADGPFVRVNCGAVPPDLIDSELFGHEKGSFTGALGVRRGWFERADGGTLFLDEIGELTPAVQIRLLRVLQDGIVQRVGSERDIAVDVRVIAATHRDLPSMVQEGRFREDLWYRLAVFPVILPPLREHPEDVPQLARHFVQRAANRLGVPVPPLNERDIARLQQYRWPGNVRELAAVLERAVILGQGTTLEVETALGVSSPAARTPAAEGVQRAPQRADENAAGVESLNAAVTAHLERALRATGGRVDGPQGAARLLGVNASTLRAKLRKLRVDPKGFQRRNA